MPTNSQKEAVYTRLRALCDAVYEEALRSPEFFARIEEVLLSPDAKVSVQQKSPTPQRPSLNTVEILHRDGESGLLSALEQLTNDDLIRLCTADGIKKSKDAKALDRQQLIGLLTSTATSRLNQGESFTKKG